MSLHDLPILREQIKKYLPQRDPFLFVDRVISLSENSITIESDVQEDADFFKGHFPGNPIMPGVLIIETLAQTGALLVALSHGTDEGKFLAFTNVDAVKFRQPVYPNETIRVDVEIERMRGPYYKFAGTAYVEDKVVTTLKFAAAQMSHS